MTVLSSPMPGRILTFSVTIPSLAIVSQCIVFTQIYKKVGNGRLCAPTVFVYVQTNAPVVRPRVASLVSSLTGVVHSQFLNCATHLEIVE